MRRFLRYWLPPLVWALVIFVGSTDLMSAQQTSRFIAPFLQWLVPDIAPETIRTIQFGLRKAAHVAEYAILAALLLRAVRGDRRELRWHDAALAVVIAAVGAALDEYHQSFVASRTGSPGDVLIDLCGAVLGASACWWLLSRRNRKRTSDGGRRLVQADAAQ